MKYRILHESADRLRIHLPKVRVSADEADSLYEYLNESPLVSKASVSERSGNAVICFTGDVSAIMQLLDAFSFQEYEGDGSGRARSIAKEYEEKLFAHVLKRCAKRFLLPSGIRAVLTAVNAVRYVLPGIRSLLKGKLQVEVLDAVTITASMATGSYDTASDIMFLLGISEILEEWTHKKSVDDLARSMSLNIDRVWLKRADGTEILMPVREIEENDVIIVRAGNTIPLDGIAVRGEAQVSQASLTGEPLPVFKKEGSYVYGGTVMEEGELMIRVVKAAGSGRYDSIVKMIEDSEKLTSESENRAARLADSLVPWCLGATGLTYLFTRDITRAMSVLMVDFSCALKLSIPIAVLSAMREASDAGIRVKGGKYLERCAKAETMVFDKTGTLTYSTPRVAAVIPFAGNDRREMLRLAACLEEHYPHSIANAVVAEAKAQGLVHEEEHSKVEYVVAHGIASSIRGKKVIIGSYHFVFEDEKTVIPEGEQERFDSLPEQYSLLYMAIGGTLAAVICIEDPIREEAAAAVRGLHEAGVSRIAMMTGDSEKTAAAVARAVGVDFYASEVLPQDKAAFIDAEHEKGHTVIMIGDGINDTPALSKADVAVAVSDGSPIAREIADLTVGDDLRSLLAAREISALLMRRISQNYFMIMTFNSGLIALGMLGVLQPSFTAYAHNLSTLLISLHSMSRLRKQTD